MQGLGLLLRKELLEMVRTKRLPIVLIVFAVLGLVSPVTARYKREILEAVGGAQFQGVIPDPVAGDAVAQLTTNLGQFGVLIAILVTMGSVAGEKDRGTAAFVLTKPVGRGAFLGAKAVAVGLLMAAAVIVAGILCWVYTAMLFEPPPIDSFYFCLITLATIGYGDLSPATDVGKLVTIIYSIAGLGIMAALIASIATQRLSAYRDTAGLDEATAGDETSGATGTTMSDPRH